MGYCPGSQSTWRTWTTPLGDDPPQGHWEKKPDKDWVAEARAAWGDAAVYVSNNGKDF